MDTPLLAKMVRELILENDAVTLPGIGTFVAELVGASFSDKGYTINPPYRRLSFTQRRVRTRCWPTSTPRPTTFPTNPRCRS